MVGRVLPNSRPHGEDHRGADGGEQTEILRLMTTGAEIPGCKKSNRRAKTQIHRALDFLQGAVRALSVIHFSLRV